MSNKFEDVGWSYVDITATAQQRVESMLRSAGARIESINITNIVSKFETFKKSREYESEYKAYAGSFEHCLLEKITEHYLSFLLINPKPKMIGVDIGSCQSVIASLGRRLYDVRYFEQDLEYPSGVLDDRIGSNADTIPLPDESVDFMTCTCTFEHFENNADTGFVNECARLLKMGGKVVILPLYLCESFCNVTGETDAETRAKIGFDTAADHYCLIPEWQNRFGRHYSPEVFMSRVWHPAIASGLRPCLYKVDNWDSIHRDLWLRWILVLER